MIGIKRTLKFIIFFPIFSFHLYAQYREAVLPKNVIISGLSFRSHDYGIITAYNDTSIFIVQLDDQNEASFIEVILFHPEFKSTTVSSSNPFWLNDTTAVLIQNTYTFEYSIGGFLNIMMSRDKGHQWQSILDLTPFFFIQRIQVLNDSTFYMAVTSDIMNSLEIYKCTNHQNHVSWEERYLTGEYDSKFVCLNSDVLLIPSINDSVYYYDFKKDLVQGVRTNITNQGFRPLFNELTKGLSGELIGIREEGIYRSSDAGTSWNQVILDSGFQALQCLPSGYWWILRNENGRSTILRSKDFGITWDEILYFDYQYMGFVTTDSDWFWLFREDRPGQVQYGQYNPVAVEQPHLQLKQTSIIMDIFPNPFNAITTIQYELCQPGFVQFRVCNMRGQRIFCSAINYQTQGRHHFFWEGTNDHSEPVSSGVYLAEIVVDKKAILKKKLMLLK